MFPKDLDRLLKKKNYPPTFKMPDSKENFWSDADIQKAS